MPNRISGVEFARLTSLYRYGVLDTEADPAIGIVLRTLADRLDVPVVQLLFADVQHLVATHSVGPVEPRHLRARGPFETLLAGGPDMIAFSGEASTLPQSSLPLQTFAAKRILSLEEETIGLLYIADTQPRAFPPDAGEALAAAVADIGVLLESARRAREHAGTGALQRDAFLAKAQRLVEACGLGRQWASLVTLDLAAFRKALESKSQGLGSLATRLLADLSRTQVRRRDSFGHLGEDRFAILLTDTAEAGARVLATRLSRHLERGWLDAGLATEGIVLGIASTRPSAGAPSLQILLDRTEAQAMVFPAADVAAARVA